MNGKCWFRGVSALMAAAVILAFCGNAAAQSAGAYTYVFPKFTDQSNSGFAVGVLGDRPVQFNCTFYNADGTLTQFVYTEGPPGFMARLNQPALKNLGVKDFSGGVVCDNLTPLTIMESVGAEDGSFDNVAQAVHSSRLVLPFSQGTFGTSEISVFNAENADTDVILAAIDTNGNTVGTIRRRLPPHGTLRDTVVYSIIASEWPTVKAHLTYQLAARSSGE